MSMEGMDEVREFEYAYRDIRIFGRKGDAIRDNFIWHFRFVHEPTGLSFETFGEYPNRKAANMAALELAMALWEFRNSSVNDKKGGLT